MAEKFVFSMSNQSALELNIYTDMLSGFDKTTMLPREITLKPGTTTESYELLAESRGFLIIGFISKGKGTGPDGRVEITFDVNAGRKWGRMAYVKGGSRLFYSPFHYGDGGKRRVHALLFADCEGPGRLTSKTQIVFSG